MASIYRTSHEGAYGTDSASTYASSASSTFTKSISRHGTDPYDDRSPASVKRTDSMRLYAQSMYERETNIDEPYEVSDLEDSEEDIKIRPGIPSKANRLLGLDTSVSQPKRASNASAKSHKLHLKGKQPPVDPFLPQNLPTETENIAPKALRTLGIRSSALSRPLTTHHEEYSPQQNSAHVPFDPDDFDRVVASNQRADNASNTDASSLSRGSTLSWRTETPRSSQEVHLDDFKWSQRQSEFSQRQDIKANTSAVLTEPFSPVSCRTFSQFSPPEDSNSFVFELPAEVPAAFRSNDKLHFIAELPAAGMEEAPIFELPALPQDVAELPAVDSDLPQSAGSEHVSLPELHSGSVSQELLKTGVEESSLDAYQLRPTTYEKPTTPGQANVMISAAVERAQMPPRHPTTRSILNGNGESIMRAQSCEGLASRHRNDQITKSRSAEFSRQESVPEAPMSPRLRQTGLATIAANPAARAQRADSMSSSAAHGLVARSKYNAESMPRVSTLSRESQSSLREQIFVDHDRHDTRSQTMPVATKASPVEEYPESPVTGHLAGQPVFRSQTLPVADRMALGPDEIPVQLDFPSPPQRTDSPQSLAPFYHKEGYI